MNKKQGWIKIHRDLLDSNFWKLSKGEKLSKREAWLEILLLANHSTSKFMNNGIITIVERGQLVRSKGELSKRWNWNRKTTRNFLKKLESTQQITQEISNSTTIITVVNYEKYQNLEVPTTQQTTQQTTHIQECNKNILKNVKEQQAPDEPDLCVENLDKLSGKNERDISKDPLGDYQFTEPKEQAALSEIDKELEWASFIKLYPSEADMGLKNKNGRGTAKKRFFKFSPDDRMRIIQELKNAQPSILKNRYLTWMSSLLKDNTEANSLIEEIRAIKPSVERKKNIGHRAMDGFQSSLKPDGTKDYSKAPPGTTVNIIDGDAIVAELRAKGLLK